jgi:WD40 repeat protein
MYSNSVPIFAFLQPSSAFSGDFLKRIKSLLEKSNNLIEYHAERLRSRPHSLTSSPSHSLTTASCWRLASWDQIVRLWNPATGAALQTLEGHTHSVTPAAFSHDGKLLASASWDQAVRLWDPATGAALQTLNVGVSLGSISFLETLNIWRLGSTAGSKGSVVGLR